MIHSPLPSPVVIAPPPVRTAAVDSLRSFITLLVIAHHAVLAYHRFAPPPNGAFSSANGIWGAFPVVDPARGSGFDTFTLWNDSFFMALMFLLSGLFAGPSLNQKGSGRFFRDRFIRLGIPFLATIVLAPLAYYPAYLQRAAATEAAGFWSAWFALGNWPAGPGWFLWMLLAFGGLAALLHRLAPGAIGKIGALGPWSRDRPVFAWIVLTVAAAIAYLPLAALVNPFAWFSWGPFVGQTGRVLLYAVYFFFGIALGARGGVGEGLFAPRGNLARRWIVWQAAALVVFAGFAFALIVTLTNAGRGVREPLWEMLAGGAFAVTGATTSFALLALFARRFSRGNAVIASLSRNAFGMYVLHYGIVTWMQYGLLPVALSGLAKGLIVTLAAVLLSWGCAAALRRIPAVARVL